MLIETGDAPRTASSQMISAIVGAVMSLPVSYSTTRISSPSRINCAVIGERRAKNVFTQNQSALLVVRGDLGGRVKVEGVGLGAKLALGDRRGIGVMRDAEEQDALVRAPHEVLDLVLRRRRRRVEQLALAVAIWGAHTVEKNGVQVGIESQIAACALNDCHGANLTGRQPTLDVPSPVPFGARACPPNPCPTRASRARRHPATVSAKMRAT